MCQVRCRSYSLMLLLVFAQGPQPEPFNALAPAAFEVPQELTNGVANIFKSVVPNFLAQLAG